MYIHTPEQVPYNEEEKRVIEKKARKEQNISAAEDQPKEVDGTRARTRGERRKEKKGKEKTKPGTVHGRVERPRQKEKKVLSTAK